MGLLQDYQTEHPNIENFNNEAIANIASIYNTENMKISNVDITRNLNVNGGLNANGGATITAAPDGWGKSLVFRNNHESPGDIGLIDFNHRDANRARIRAFNDRLDISSNEINIHGSAKMRNGASVTGDLSVSGTAKLNGLGVQWENNRSGEPRKPSFYWSRGPGIYNEFTLERLTGGNGDGWVNASTHVFWHDASAGESIVQYIYTPTGMFTRKSRNADTWENRVELASIGKTDAVQHLVIRKPNSDFNRCARKADIFVHNNVANFEDCIRTCKDSDGGLGHAFKFAIYGKQGNNNRKCWCRHSCWGHTKNDPNYDAAVII